LRCSLSRLPCRRHNGRSRAVTSNWHSRLTYVAWAVPTTALCTLVHETNSATWQKPPRALLWQSALPPTALNAVGRRVFQWKPRGSARVPTPADTCGLRTSPGGVSDSIWGSGTRRGSGTPCEVRGPQLFWLRATSSGTRGATGPSASGKRVRAVCRESRAPDHRGPTVRPSGRIYG